MRFSQQRQQVYEVLCSTTSHPDAQWVYNKVREHIPNISLGTVYRNLNELVCCGMAKKISMTGTVERFDATTAQHGHFVCKQCGCVIDVEGATPRNISIEGSVVDDIDITYYGTCKRCNNKKGGK